MYENIFKNYDKNWENREVYSIAPTAEVGIDVPDVQNMDVYMYKSRNNQPFLVGISTGRMCVINSFVYLQIVGDFGAYGYGYIKMLEVDQNRGKVVSKASAEMANILLKGIISNNKYILQNNIVCAGMIAKLDKANIKIPVELRSQLHVLQSNLMDRNNRLLNSKYLTSIQTAAPTGLDAAQKDLSAFMADPKIGILPVAVPVYVIVIAATLVGALLAWIIYLIFKPDYDKSKLELNYSDSLKAGIAKYLPKELQEQLAKENEAFVDVANAKVAGANGMGMLKTAGYAAAGLIGFMLLTNINSNLKK